jgi:sec-independent protein translocase protein TatA
MLQNLGGAHLLIILAIVVLIFGGAKLPALARSVGQSIKIFKGEVKTTDADATTANEADTAGTPLATVPRVTHAEK